MILTLFYMASTTYNFFKLRSFYSKLKQASEQSSIVFYRVPQESKGKKNITLIKFFLLKVFLPFLGASTNPPTSDLCINQSQAKISTVLWFNDNSRGCSVLPLQKINLGPFISFPQLPNMIPFKYDVREIGELDEKEFVYCLLETLDLKELNNNFGYSENVLEVSANYVTLDRYVLKVLRNFSVDFDEFGVGKILTFSSCFL